MKIKSALLLCCLAPASSLHAQQPAATPDQPPVTAPIPAEPPPPDTLLDGTAVKLRLAENLSSGSAKTGQQVPFEVTEDVSVDGVVVIPKGSQAIATVTNAVRKKNMGRAGKLDVSVDSLRLIDGERAQLRGVRDGKGKGHVAAMTTGIVATGILFFPVAPLFLLMHGRDIEIPKGTEVTAFVEGDMHLDMARMVPPGTAPTSAASQAAAQTAAMSSLSVDANVAGADIEIDGAFVGSTPSTVSVAPGQHTIAVKKKGYTDWTKTMNVSGPAVKLSADLEKSAL